MVQECSSPASPAPTTPPAPASSVLDLAHFNNEKYSDLCIKVGDNMLYVKSGLLAKHSEFFKTKVEHETLVRSGEDASCSKTMISDLSCDVDNFNALVLFCLWCYAPNCLIVTEDFENLFDLMQMTDYFLFSDTFKEKLRDSMACLVDTPNFQDEAYSYLKRKWIVPSVILEIATRSSASVKALPSVGWNFRESSSNCASACCYRQSFDRCCICAKSYCRLHQKEHEEFHHTLKDRTDAFFLFYLPAAFLSNLHCHKEGFAFDQFPFIKALKAMAPNAASLPDVLNTDGDVKDRMEIALRMIFKS